MRPVVRAIASQSGRGVIVEGETISRRRMKKEPAVLSGRVAILALLMISQRDRRDVRLANQVEREAGAKVHRLVGQQTRLDPQETLFLSIRGSRSADRRSDVAKRAR